MDANKIASLLRENATISEGRNKKHGRGNINPKSPNKSFIKKTAEKITSPIKRGAEAVGDAAKKGGSKLGGYATSAGKSVMAHKKIAGGAAIGLAAAGVAGKKYLDSKSKAKKIKENVELLQEMMLFELQMIIESELSDLAGSAAKETADLKAEIKATKDPSKLKALWARVRNLPAAAQKTFNNLPKKYKVAAGIGAAGALGAAGYGGYKAYQKKKATQESITLTESELFILQELSTYASSLQSRIAKVKALISQASNMGDQEKVAAYTKKLAGYEGALKNIGGTQKYLGKGLNTLKSLPGKFNKMGTMGKAGVIGGGLAAAGAAGYGAYRGLKKPNSQEA